ncbi:acyl-CoA dehydrogenase family protein [Riemerella anatipestifer]|uniref:Acyl-CoA dehydrogenase family protein n=1 Tax=Riemerella anatipestifer TaxID=34085 RepID=A0AAP6HD02_RIEAN|nr:acyl-CoA dehydrogenase family protein [Riemerella anatipestifer]MBT0550197.1 acyl-CoA dehydrogenase family protein [Riemerella anatipestifer]MBT0556329.1 acyl-CoA dehydrogenase family protein [Riemerella anatipestifer]MBT0560957.1 acyl-CoA dehydrogenase family protein [Riemerella anatipestifer]MCD5969289.1 acyl-CoA dehydrogenase family protein [Riemerella anatipestifer]MCO7354127.1 acyl-CoA dehydrogenase family protein [Riemerella anatipestifer]
MSYYPLNSIPDYYMLDNLLTEEHNLVRNSVRQWVQSSVIPQIDNAAQTHKEIPNLMQQLGTIGALGAYIPKEYGGAGLDQISYGIIMQELERGDSAVRSAASVQSSLVMYPIFEFGTEEQKRKFLPLLGAGEITGAFGLTEPNHGSNPSDMETHIKDMGDYFLLNGAKMWITNAPTCDIAIVWSKDETNTIRGLIVERGMEGFTTPETLNKWSLRASRTGELVFQNVKIPKENLLPNVKGIKGPLSCLNSARYGISWGVIGAAIDCYCTAVQYAKERTQFGKPIGSFQLQQKKLAEFLTEITKAQLLSWRLGLLKNENKATPAQISMAKRNNVKMALDIARESRQILGAMGIMGDFPMMRHATNLESVITYEGTHDIHLLITGMDITGISAFS